MIVRITAALSAAALAASCTSYGDEPSSAPASDSARECFFLSEVSGYTYAGKNKIHVSTGPGEKYEFETLGSCPDLDYGESIGFDPVGPGTICRGIDVDLIVPSDIGPKRCPVAMIRKLPRDEKPKR